MSGADEKLVGVAFARDPFEAEVLQGLLANGDIPSLLQPTGLIDAQLDHGDPRPGYGAGGSQRVMVRASQAEQARALLAETLVEDEEAAWPEIANARYLEEAEGGRRPRSYGLFGSYARSYLWALGFFAVTFGVFLLLRAV